MFINLIVISNFMTIEQLLLFWILLDSPYMLYLAFRIAKNGYKKTKIKDLVTILIPAYNEGVCIEKTLKSCIKQTYRPLEIIVINDGSTDNTKEVVENFIKKHKEHDIKLINQENRGKASAMNNGLKHAKGKYIVTIDADSYLKRDAIERITEKFYSEDIGAVAGNIIPISQSKILGFIQKVEYELGIRVMRNAQSYFGGVVCTPGAFSIYKKDALKRFEEGTITEDFDTSIAILERGYKVIASIDAVCYTQAPASISYLIKQRVRWQQGAYEVFAKHMFTKKRLAVSIEMFIIFFYAFYGLFPRLMIYLYPIVWSSFYALIVFFMYSCMIYSIQLSLGRPENKKMYLIMPLFIAYYYTIILYSSLVAQIKVIKNNTRWEKLKRYHM